MTHLTEDGEQVLRGLQAAIEALQASRAEVVEELRRLIGGARAEPLAYSVQDAAAVLGVSRTTLYRELATGRLVGRKRGTDTLFLRRDLEAFLEALPIVDGSALYQG